MRFRQLQCILTSVACLGILCGPTVTSGQSPASMPSSSSARTAIRDVALDQKQTLRGEVRNVDGQVQPAMDLVLWRESGAVRRTRTDRSGRFAFHQLKGGTYTILTPTSSTTCRVWTAEVAPPQARPAILVLSGVRSHRGQRPLEEAFVFNPFIMGTIIAAAIAIPIAIHNSGDDLPSGS